MGVTNLMEVSHGLAGAAPVPFWLDDPGRPAALSALAEDATCDLAVVGGGYSGLWTALIAKERDPGREVLLVEANRVGWAASGRNGGFAEASLTHGLCNGIDRFEPELRTLVKLGDANLDAMQATICKYGIECDWERTGQLSVATADWQAKDLAEYAEVAAQYGEYVEFLDAEAMRAEVDSPTYHAGLWEREGCAMVNPAKLAWGLRDACLSVGVKMYEGTRVAELEKSGTGMVLRTVAGRKITAARVALGTNVFPSLLRRVRPYIVPVYDYALMTQPLTDDQLAEIGWRNRQGIGDSANHFHYYRLSADNRILWGGYDAVYHFGNRIAPELDQRPKTFEKLARHFYETFPQLSEVEFTHKWGGVIDTCTRFCAFFDTAFEGRVAYAAGFTGLGVGATRFGAQVMLDLLAGEETELTELQLVKSKPLPFPPEPLRSMGINFTAWSLGRADHNGGKRNLWLRTLDRFGLGFDS